MVSKEYSDNNASCRRCVFLPDVPSKHDELSLGSGQSRNKGTVGRKSKLLVEVRMPRMRQQFPLVLLPKCFMLSPDSTTTSDRNGQ